MTLEDGLENESLVDGNAGHTEVEPSSYWRRFRPGWRTGILLFSALMVCVAFTPRCLKSIHFLEGLLPDGFRSLEVEFGHSQELPLVELGHISKAAGKVLCVVDVAQSVGRVLLLGNAIAAITINCDFGRIKRVNKRPVTQDERQTCAITIIGALVNTALGLGAASSSVSTCSGSLNVPANCAANINGFIGNVLVLAGTAMSADLSCPRNPADTVKREKARIEQAKEAAQEAARKWLRNAGQDVSHLPAPPAALPADTVYRQIDRCVGHLDLATTFVMKAGVIIADSTMHCAADYIDDSDDERVCAIDIIGLTGVLSLATRFYSLAANSCIAIVGRLGSFDASCSADCAGIIAGVTASTAPAMNLQAACQKAFEMWNPDEWPKNEFIRQSGSKQGYTKTAISRMRAAYGDIIVPSP
ncbi:unnamed protein product [Symbiodinium sp. KB8]|nr:unnamed protein product [Symbiodinium sp. KB8]